MIKMGRIVIFVWMIVWSVVENTFADDLIPIDKRE